jgi:hypothetical protein
MTVTVQTCTFHTFLSNDIMYILFADRLTGGETYVAKVTAVYEFAVGPSSLTSHSGAVTVDTSSPTVSFVLPLSQSYMHDDMGFPAALNVSGSLLLSNDVSAVSAVELRIGRNCGTGGVVAYTQVRTVAYGTVCCDFTVT